MTSPPSYSFSKPAMPGDAVSVLVLVEDSATMAAKWPDVRDSYLPKLLENLRSADPSVQMDARWLTTSSASAASPPVVVVDAAQAQMPVDVPLKREGCPTKFSPAVIANAISILSSASRRQNTTRHLILVAATGPLTQGPFNDTTPSGFDAWDDIAVVLKQQYMRLHVILSVGAEMRTYHELFKRSLQLQNNSEVPAWFSVDSNRYSIRLSGRPQYVRGSAALPIPLVPTAIPEDTYNDPTTPAPSPPSLSPPETASTPSSPSHSTSPGARKSSTSPTNIRTRHRGGDPPQSPPTTDGGGGLVSYLQQMHGLTKKKSYGIKAPKKTYADIRLPNAGRPILPRLEVPPSQSDIYTYPTFDNVQGTETQVPVAEPQLPPPRRHSVDQLPSASLVARTNNEDRRARRRGPWLPIAPPASSTPSSPTSTTSPGTLAALQSLASMTPRLPDFVTKDRTPPAVAGATDPRSAYPMPSLAASTPPPGAGYYANAVQSWQQQQASVVTSPVSAAPSPTHAVSSSTMSDGSRFRTSPPTPQLIGSDYTNGSSPPSSTAATPLSLSAPMGADSTEDQPFVVTPEYEAMVNARFDEAVRSGAMHASMTPAIRSAVPVSMSSASPAPAYTSSLVAPAQEQSFYPGYSSAMPHAGMMDMHDTGYATYQSVHDMGEYPDSGDPANGVWEYPVAESYMPTMQEYTHAQGQWYAS